MRRRLKRAGILRKVGHWYYTTQERLATHDPDALEVYLSSLGPEPDPEDCPACADMRLTVAELEWQTTELADRLKRCEQQRHADKRKTGPKPA